MRSKDELMKVVNMLRSHEAAEYLISLFPLESEDYWRVFALIESRSWSSIGRWRLFRYYMRKPSFASARPYDVFAGIMPLAEFLAGMLKVFPDGIRDAELCL